jgi:hypothetical protein
MDAGSPSPADANMLPTKNYTWTDPTSSKFSWKHLFEGSLKVLTSLNTRTWKKKQKQKQKKSGGGGGGMDAGSPRGPQHRSRENHATNQKLHMGGSHKFEVQLETHIRTFPESFRRWGAKKKKSTLFGKPRSVWEVTHLYSPYPVPGSVCWETWKELVLSQMPWWSTYSIVSFLGPIRTIPEGGSTWIWVL